MQFFPAIDLKDGNCVRLIQGRMDKETVFNNNPGAQAERFQQQGAQWLHIVDLDGAFSGGSVNDQAIRDILNTIMIPAQLGGGIRSIKNIEYWLSLGIRRVILGTSAYRDPELVLESCRLFPGQVVVGIDAKNGMVAVEGWSQVSNMPAIDLAIKLENTGVAAIIYTDIAKDGLMGGPSIEVTLSLASKISTPVILSGGISCIADLAVLIEQAKKLNTHLEGVISGRAIYDGKIDIYEATQLCGDFGKC